MTATTPPPPAVDLATAVDLAQFCATATDPREYLHTPWRRGDWVYAMNGHVCVRVPAESMPEVAESANPVAAGAEAMFQKHLEQRKCEFQPMPKLKKVTKCIQCLGKGTTKMAKCDSCDEGEFVRGGYSYSCQNCYGGWLPTDDKRGGKDRPCHLCAGTGDPVGMNDIVRLGESTYSLVYLSWLAALPLIRVCPGNRAGQDRADTIPAVFMFHGGQALLMPKRFC